MKATISVDDPHEQIVRLFAAEEHKLVNDRAHYITEHTSGFTNIIVEAQDATALRATLNSVSKVLIVYEKTKKVVES